MIKPTMAPRTGCATSYLRRATNDDRDVNPCINCPRLLRHGTSNLPTRPLPTNGISPTDNNSHTDGDCYTDHANDALRTYDTTTSSAPTTSGLHVSPNSSSDTPSHASFHVSNVKLFSWLTRLDGRSSKQHVTHLLSIYDIFLNSM